MCSKKRSVQAEVEGGEKIEEVGRESIGPREEERGEAKGEGREIEEDTGHAEGTEGAETSEEEGAGGGH